MEKVVQVTPAQQPTQQSEQNMGVMKKFNQPKKSSMGRSASGRKKWPIFVVVALVVILAGVGTGWVLAGSPKGSSKKTSDSTTEGVVDTKTEAGLEDESQFEEPVEGDLKSGGFDGEGTHYLDRGMGEEKNVYLVSQVLDLESFVGKKVRIWGNTITAEKAPWLMDVGKIKVIE